MEFFQKAKRYIIRNNGDIFAVYKMKIYTSDTVLLDYKIIRLIFLMLLFIKKYFFKINVYKEIDSILNVISDKQESKISKKNNSNLMLKNCIDSDIVIMNIWDALLCLNFDVKFVKSNNIKNAKEKILSINSYGLEIYRLLEYNKKCIILLDDQNVLENAVKKLLVSHNITVDNIIHVESDLAKHSININSFLDSHFPNVTSVAYIGKFFHSNLFKKTKKIVFYPYENPAFWGEKFRPNDDSSIKFSIYKHLINNRLHTMNRRLNKYYEFGYTYGGIITYYLFCEMTQKDQSFAKTYDIFKKDICSNLNNEQINFLNQLMDVIFPAYINNLAYDEPKQEKSFTKIDLEKQRNVQQGIVDFCVDFENKLYDIVNDNTINYKMISHFMNYIILNMDRKMWRRIW